MNPAWSALGRVGGLLTAADWPAAVKPLLRDERSCTRGAACGGAGEEAEGSGDSGTYVFTSVSAFALTLTPDLDPDPEREPEPRSQPQHTSWLVPLPSAQAYGP